MEAGLPIGHEGTPSAGRTMPGRRPAGATAALLAALDLDQGFPPLVRRAASAWLHANAAAVPKGPWEGPTSSDSTVVHVVTDGFILATTQTHGGIAAEVLGPGDVICVDGDGADGGVVERSTGWIALTPGSVLALDEQRFGRAMGSPEVIRALVCAIDRRVRRMTGNHAIASVVRVEHRVLAQLWQLADEWGRVTPDGIAIPIPLTHCAMANIIGCERPSVTSSLGRLGNRGWVRRCDGGTWMLAQDAPRPPTE